MDIATTVEATCAAIGVFLMIGGVVFTAGRFKQVMDDMTKAIDKLTGVFDRFSGDTDKMLLNHEIRIAVLESKDEK